MSLPKNFREIMNYQEPQIGLPIKVKDITGKSLRKDARYYLARFSRLEFRSLIILADRVSSYAQKVSQNQREPILVVGNERTGVPYIWRIPEVEQQLKAQLDGKELKKFYEDLRKNTVQIRKLLIQKNVPYIWRTPEMEQHLKTQFSDAEVKKFYENSQKKPISDFKSKIDRLAMLETGRKWLQTKRLNYLVITSTHYFPSANYMADSLEKFQERHPTLDSPPTTMIVDSSSGLEKTQPRALSNLYRILTQGGMDPWRPTTIKERLRKLIRPPHLEKVYYIPAKTRPNPKTTSKIILFNPTTRNFSKVAAWHDDQYGFVLRSGEHPRPDEVFLAALFKRIIKSGNIPRSISKR